MSPAKIRSRRMIPDCTTIATDPKRFGFHVALRRLALSILALACLSQARAAPFAYVPNERSGTVSVIDTASDQVVATIKTGGKPRGIAATPDGRRLYVSDQPSGSLLVVDLTAREVSERIPVGKSPEGVGISRDGAWIAVAVEGNNSGSLMRAEAARRATSVRVSGQNPEHA